MSSLKAFFRNLTSTGDSGDSQEDPLIISDTEVRKPDESLEAPRYDEEEAQHVKTDEIEDSDAIPGSPPNQSHGEEGREEGGDKRPSKRARRDDSQEDLPAAGREHELRAAREAKHAAEDDAHEAKRELRRAERAYRRLEADLRADGNQLQETLRRQTEANASLSMEVEELRALLATRAAELRNAEQYLAKTDTVSHADIARLLQRLNSEILQLCAPLADACRPRSEPRSAPTDEDPVSLREKVARRLGQHAVDALISVRQGQFDFVCVQMALQTLLSRAAAVTISAWDANLVRAWESELHTPPDAVSSDLLLRRLHEIIYQSETQAVSARWRALTIQSLKQVEGISPLEAIWSRVLCEIDDVTRLAAGPRMDVPEDERTSVQDKVKNILALAWQLRDYVGQIVASSDFYVIVPAPGEVFNKAWMEDAWGDNKRAQLPESVVLFVTELGLRRREKVDSGTAGDGQPVIREAIPVKAKVVLTTSLDDLGA